MESGGSSINDIIELAIIKAKKDNNGKFHTIDVFHRFYYPLNEIGFHHFKTHGIDLDRIEKERNASSDFFAEYYKDDIDIASFCQGERTVVAHNVSFEKRHISRHFFFDQYFCTMAQNKNILKLSSPSGRNCFKPPTLREVCLFYDIAFDERNYHSAIYDAEKTLEVVNRMDLSLRSLILS